jgi:hypothetical protein
VASRDSGFYPPSPRAVTLLGGGDAHAAGGHWAGLAEGGVGSARASRPFLTAADGRGPGSRGRGAAAQFREVAVGVAVLTVWNSGGGPVVILSARDLESLGGVIGSLGFCFVTALSTLLCRFYVFHRQAFLCAIHGVISTEFHPNRKY